ncbi:helix-turn-helix transcriptional regulator [Actinopolyspora saharensis]|uniref:Predicted DNA-binding transcriptional regulator YafY, contains an HTH and WYL domains n=1 Tax=Actinopolyspora saharensis TaxID=995062 RepID=A0A1H1G409_9ACTN|nr:YafY family protein [Actinopolyspora saharensis]SDR07900.1 Predicted DNA-binding transcriptional regulator YafY, contains an HTH and WYL domains [Actinopolyspora saharensis]
MKSDRLLAILLILQVERRARATELAGRLEVSPRTIHRDVEALSAAGVPVYTERGRNGGVRLLSGFRTDVSGLTPDEARALFVPATGNVHGALGLSGALGSALRKVLSALPETHRPTAERTSGRVLVDPDRWMSDARPPAELDLLHSAVLSDSGVRIEYRHSGETTTREYAVDPYGLVCKAGVWYLVADHRRSPRLFRADRIARTELTGRAARHRDVSLAEVWEKLRRDVQERPELVRVRARMRTHRLDMAGRIIGSRMSVRPEGEHSTGEWTEIELHCPALGAVRQLLQFGADAEVLEPPEARAEAARGARELAELYADG